MWLNNHNDYYFIVNYFEIAANSSTNNNNTYTNNNNTTNITCREDFDLIDNACLPRCDKFDSNSKVATSTLISSEIVAVTIGLCVCFLIILFSIPNYKNMYVNDKINSAHSHTQPHTHTHCSSSVELIQNLADIQIEPICYQCNATNLWSLFQWCVSKCLLTHHWNKDHKFVHCNMTPW